jgi:hypothetical protein
MITSNTSEYVPGEIIIYIFSCCDHVRHHLEEHYRLLLKLEISDLRRDLIDSCNKIFEDGILMKIGYYAEEFKNVSLIIIFYCLICNIIIVFSSNFVVGLIIPLPASLS